MIQLQADINAICAAHPEPYKKRLVRGVESLEKMAKFYESKAPDSRDGGTTFYGYASTLMYAIAILNKYDALTHELAELASESGNDVEYESKPNKEQ